MPFNFDIKSTLVFQSLKRWSFPLFKYSSFLSQLFLYLFFISLLLVGFYFFGFVSYYVAVKVPLLLLFFLILFWEVYLFSEFKIKKPNIDTSLSDAVLRQDDYNLAEFLSLESCDIVEESIEICKKRSLSEVSSEALFYSALAESKDVQMLMFRLGMDVKKIQSDLKNYLEKQERQEREITPPFSQSFQDTIKKAAELAESRGYQTISEKELLAGLASHDEFFKKILIERDLKEKDVEDITLWLDTLEEKVLQSKKFWLKENLSKFGSLGKDFASGFTITLDSFSIDLSKITSKNIFNEIVGHKQEIDELETVLAKSSESNALILGESGSGRKSIVEALAQRCYLGQSLSELNNKRIVELDMVSLTAQIQDPEKLETTLDQIFEEALSSGNVILLIDQLDDFVGQKFTKPGTVDISSILGKYLAIPSFKFIGITSFEGLHQKLEANPSFLEYFRKIEVLEISESETIRILQNLALGMEYKYKILILYPSIREIISLTGRYLPSVPFPKKAIDVLSEVSVYVRELKENVVEPCHVAKIISDKTQIPVGKLEFKEKSVLLNLENLIHQRIINQEEAVSEISIAMRRARSGLSSGKRPMGVFMFLGPTGVGKTETAKALAKIYFNGEEKMIRLDMSEFQSVSDIARLIGATSPVEQQGLLTTPVREKPFSLVLLDEIEKAHINILNLFLQVFDEGHITDGQGRKVIFTNTIIICTSNAGAPMIFKAVESGQKLEKDKLLDSLFEKGTFKPEFINRFDATVIFHPLIKENLMEIAQLMLEDLAKSLKEKDIDLVITDALKEKIVELSYKPEFGAREMRRVVQDKVENNVAEALLSDKIVKGDKIEINPENFEVIKIAQ